MTRVPKFIPSDKVRLKEGDGTVMSIQKFKYVFADGRSKYSGLVTCYWDENGKQQTEIFNEEDLEVVRETAS